MENDVGRAIAHLRYLLNDARRSETRIPLLKTDGQALLDHIAALEADLAAVEHLNDELRGILVSEGYNVEKLEHLRAARRPADGAPAHGQDAP